MFHNNCSLSDLLFYASVIANAIDQLIAQDREVLIRLTNIRSCKYYGKQTRGNVHECNSGFLRRTSAPHCKSQETQRNVNLKIFLLRSLDESLPLIALYIFFLHSFRNRFIDFCSSRFYSIKFDDLICIFIQLYNIFDI